MLDLTVIMPTLPERGKLRAEALASLDEQTLPARERLLFYDFEKRGPVWVCNELAEDVTTEWLFPMADDDLLDPDHFETLYGAMGCEFEQEPADIVYSWCRVTGRADIREDMFQLAPPEHADTTSFFEQLRQRNFIPASAAIRTSLWRDLGGYRDPGLLRHEDWDFWLRALNVGARFRCVPKVTWTYRVDRAWPHLSEVNG